MRRKQRFLENYDFEKEIEDILEAAGVELPPDPAGETHAQCGMCALGAHLVPIDDRYFRESMQWAPPDLSVGEARQAARRSALIAVAAVAIELALEDPEWVAGLLAALPFDEAELEAAARRIRERFED